MGEFTRKSIRELFGQQPGCDVTVKGWVRTKRGNKNVSFIALNDGSTIRNMQIVCDGQKFSEELMKDIKYIRDTFDMTVLLIEHDMKLVSGICEKLTVLNFGKVLTEGDTSEVLHDPEVIKAYLGE